MASKLIQTLAAGVVLAAAPLDNAAQSPQDFVFAGIPIRVADYTAAQQKNETLQKTSLLTGQTVGLILKGEGVTYTVSGDREAIAAMPEKDNLPNLSFTTAKKGMPPVPTTKKDFKEKVLPEMMNVIQAMDETQVIDLQEIAKKALKTKKGIKGMFGRSFGVSDNQVCQEIENQLTLVFNHSTNSNPITLAAANKTTWR